MLEFTKLTIRNFGPYKDNQVLDFENGVTIIWGDNGRGKTTLLNAFRYALYGKIVHRSKNKKDKLKSLCNWENKEKGLYEFSVVLAMRYDGQDYELSRSYRLKPGLSEPKSDNDFEEDVSLKKGNSYLSQDQRNHYLNKIMPEQISRFFLFDGELLSEYEDLIDNDKAIGAKIKESIEKILGLPILSNAYNDIKHTHELLQDEYTQIAKKDARNKEIVGTLEAAKIKHGNMQTAMSNYKSEREIKYRERTSLEEDLKRTEKIRLLIERKDGWKKTISSNEKKRDLYRDELKKYTKQAWLCVLSGIISEKVKTIEDEIRKLEDNKNKANTDANKVERLIRAMESCICPTCKRVLDEEHRIGIQKQLEDAEKSVHLFSPEEQNRLEHLGTCKLRINKHINDNIKDLISDAEDRLANVIVEISDAKGQVEDLEKSIGLEDDQENVLSIRTDYNKVNNSITLLNQVIDRLQIEIDDIDSSITSLNNKLGKVATGSEFDSISNVKDTAGKLKVIFGKGIEVYRDRLKGKVEMDASKLFKSISNEPDFVNLNINDNYGLNIVFDDGQINENRSAGYEHIVAISLIGALQKNAPMRGPVVMDSPFGRLDKNHSRRISSALESLSHQVILFAYEGEIDMQTARETLGSKLTHEYYLKRVSGRHTQITILEDE